MRFVQENILIFNTFVFHCIVNRILNDGVYKKKKNFVCSLTKLSSQNKRF